MARGIHFYFTAPISLNGKILKNTFPFISLLSTSPNEGSLLSIDSFLLSPRTKYLLFGITPSGQSLLEQISSNKKL